MMLASSHQPRPVHDALIGSAVYSQDRDDIGENHMQDIGEDNLQ